MELQVLLLWSAPGFSLASRAPRFASGLPAGFSTIRREDNSSLLADVLTRSIFIRGAVGLVILIRRRIKK
jgi:hypothetical protein